MRALRRIAPAEHVDVASSLSFVTMASAFVPVVFLDLRPAPLNLSSLVCRKGDVTGLPFATESVRSISCMHVVEHIGLGRYGDPLDAKGDLKAMTELARVLAPRGDLLFVVPVGGVARIQYNAHRIYTYDMVLSGFPSCSVRDFSLVADDGSFREHADPEDARAQKYGCGCFWFRKR